ncbi:MAG: MaoC/PaaZ C-terminal domain-containing protein [Acidimicrobiales bacterium]
MALPRERLGEERRWVRTVDLDRARPYAAATNDPNPAYLDGTYAPPLFGVVPTWEAFQAICDDLVPLELNPMMLHAEHDMRFHRPLVPGMTLSTTSRGYSYRVARSGTWITALIASEDHTGQPVLDQFATVFVRTMQGAGDWGPERPAHGFPEGAREHLRAEVKRHVDDDQTFRYRDASGDANAIHVDEEFARAAKLPGIILHGLCTMAMCGSAVIDEVAGRDPARLARLAVRFSKPVFPGNDLLVSLYGEGSDGTWAFEATAGGNKVVRDGLAELRD